MSFFRNLHRELGFVCLKQKDRRKYWVGFLADHIIEFSRSLRIFFLFISAACLNGMLLSMESVLWFVIRFWRLSSLWNDFLFAGAVVLYFFSREQLYENRRFFTILSAELYSISAFYISLHQHFFFLFFLLIFFGSFVAASLVFDVVVAHVLCYSYVFLMLKSYEIK